MGFGAEGDPKAQMFNLGLGAQGAVGGPKPQIHKLVSDGHVGPIVLML